MVLTYIHFRILKFPLTSCWGESSSTFYRMVPPFDSVQLVQITPITMAYRGYIYSWLPKCFIQSWTCILNSNKYGFWWYIELVNELITKLYWGGTTLYFSANSLRVFSHQPPVGPWPPHVAQRVPGNSPQSCYLSSEISLLTIWSCKTSLETTCKSQPTKNDLENSRMIYWNSGPQVVKRCWMFYLDPNFENPTRFIHVLSCSSGYPWNIREYRYPSELFPLTRDAHLTSNLGCRGRCSSTIQSTALSQQSFLNVKGKGSSPWANYSFGFDWK